MANDVAIAHASHGGSGTQSAVRKGAAKHISSAPEEGIKIQLTNCLLDVEAKLKSMLTQVA